MPLSAAARRARPRLAVEALEDRAVPANNLTVTNDPDSFNVSVTFTQDAAHIATTGPGARLSLATLGAVLTQPGVHRVTVTTAADAPADDGQEAGSILWPAGVGNPDLSGLDTHLSLQFQTVPGTNAVGNIDLTGVTFDAPTPDRLSVGFDTAQVNGAITFHDDGVAGVTFGPGVGSLGLSAGTGAITYEGNGGSAGVRVSGRFFASGGAVTLAPAGGIEALTVVAGGQSLTLGGRLEARTDDLTFFTPITLAADTELIADRGGIELGKTVDGPHTLSLRAGGVRYFSLVGVRGAAIYGRVGGTTPLAGLTIEAGMVEMVGPAMDVGTLQVGTGAADSRATFGARGTLTGDVVVRSDGVFSAGGLDAVGTLTVAGDVTFDGGTYAPDLGAPGDLLTVTGDVTLTGATLGGGFGIGALPDGPAQVLDFAGTLTGTFSNAPVGTAAIVGNDAVAVTDYGPAGTGVVLAPLPPGPAPKRLTGVEADGTAYTAVLIGPGQLVSGADFLGRRFLVVRGAKPTTAVTVTTRANASDAVVTFDGGVAVSGPLGLFSAPKVNVAYQFVAGAPVGSILVRDLVETGGVGLRLPDVRTRASVTARNVSAHVWTAGKLTALRLTGDLTGDVYGVSFGSVRLRNLAATARLQVGDALNSFTATGDVAGTFHTRGLGSFQAAEVTPSGRVEFDNIGGAATVTGRLAGVLTGTELPQLTAGEVDGGVIDALVIGTLRVARDFNGRIHGQNIELFVARGGSAVLDLNEAGVVGTIRATGVGMDLAVHAGRISAVEVAGTLRGLGAWTAQGIGRLTAGAIDGLDLTTTYLGPVLVRGNPTFDLGGEIRDSVFHTTSSRELFGIASLTVTGNVVGSTFDVDNADVGAVAVGRFLDSRLYVDYTPGGDFATGGSFDHPFTHTLASFTTTAVRSPAGGPSAFEGSEVAADTVGAVRLSGLRTANDGTPFGLKVRSAFGSVRVAAADDPAVPRNTDLTPSDTAIAGNFFFLDV
jgi:hypothetical protein